MTARVRGLDARVAMDPPRRIWTIVDNTFAQPPLLARLFAGFGAVGLALAARAGVMVGAVLRVPVTRDARPLGTLRLAFAVQGVLGGMLFQVRTNDPLTWSALALAILAAAMGAT